MAIALTAVSTGDRASSTCVDPGYVGPKRKHVKVGGLTWAVFSRNERTTTHAGRHFFAARCNPKRPWRIYEDDCDGLQTGGAKPLLVFLSDYDTESLSESVRQIC